MKRQSAKLACFALLFSATAFSILTPSAPDLLAADAMSAATSKTDKDGDATPEAKAEPTPEEAEAERLVQYYLRMFSKHLESSDWMARAMGVISLARIDDGRTTARLMKVMREDKMPVVRAYAWEALHARQNRLDSEQRAEWVETGFELAKKGALRGDMRLGVIGLIGAAGPTRQNKKIIVGLFENTNSMDPSDIRTLRALGDIIAKWQSGDIIRYLVERMGALNDAYRAELVLHRVHDGIPYSYLAPVPPEIKSKDWYKKLNQEGSNVMWRETRKRWVEWFKEQEFQEIDPGELGPYEGTSVLMPAGEKITGGDRKWFRDLELSEFRIKHLDVGFVVDSTGSMGKVIRWIQHDVVKMLRAFSLISYEPRIGVTLFRDHGEKYLLKHIPLTGNAQALQRVMSREGAGGGGDIPEAVHAALESVIQRKDWSRQAGAKKVIVLLGDAPPHKNTMEKLEDLLKSYRESEFIVNVFKVRTTHAREARRYEDEQSWDPSLVSFDKIADWGGGKSFGVEFLAERETEGRQWRGVGTAAPNDENTPERMVFRAILHSLLEEGYKDRVDPFINVLLEYVEEPMKEVRKPFGRAGRGKRNYKNPQKSG